MPPTKSKPQTDDDTADDISQLRKPITIHGTPVEQILNSIHYGSPELRSLLMDECDIIFECKVCRALFRDLPNFIAHKRRYCSKSAADLNHYSIAELPEEKVVVVHPKPVDDDDDDSNIRNVSTQPTSSSRSSLEDTVHRIRNGQGGKSHAFRVQSKAAAKLRRQKENARITCIRTRSIPSNSNAMFVDVSTTSVNYHDRPSTSRSSDKPLQSVKTVTKRARDKCRNGEGAQPPSKLSNRSKDDASNINNMLMKELKAIQNQSKVKQSAHSNNADKIQQQSCKAEKVRQEVSDEVQKVEQKKTKAPVRVDISSPKKTADNEESQRENVLLNSKNLDEAGLVERTNEDVKTPLVRTDNTLKGVNHVKTELMKTGKVSKAPVVKTDKVLIEEDVKAALVKRKKTVKEEDEEVSSEVSSSKASSVKGELVSQRKLRKNKNSLICSKCSNIFSCKRSLRFHVKVHHSVKRTLYPCPLCSRVYYFMSAALRHLEINHGKSKAERNKLREDVHSKIFVKPIPLQESVKNAKSTLMSSRQDRRSRRMVNKTPYVYSSMNQRKRLPSKKDSILNTTSVEKTERLSNESKSPVKSSRLRQKHFTLDIKDESPSRTVNGRTSSPSVIKEHSPKIDTQMQRCPKCSRLFGRKATFENHIKVCDGKTHISNSVNKPVQNDHENTSSSSVSTRRKGKPYPSASLSSGNDEVDSCESTSSSTEKSCAKSTAKVDFSPETDKLLCSSHKTLASGSADAPFTVTRLKSKASSEVGDIFIASTNSDEPIFKMDIAPSLTKSDQSTVENDNDNSLDSEKDDVHQNLVIKDKVLRSDAKNNSTKVKAKLETTQLCNVLERPKRKRKIPSRNIGAMELLQKIHRVDKKDESPSRKRLRKVEDKDGDEQHSVLRTRATANKVFVLNSSNQGTCKSKLQCYNHSRVGKFVDEKKIACLKCGAKFSFMHNLKRHIIRLHLKWSRFQCKLCNFNCFDKSECNTHIIRQHRKGQKPGRNHFFNTLIIDLARKGSKAMALKKHQTIVANSRRKEDEKNIYENKNTQKVPRLHERTSDANKSVSSPTVNSLEKQKFNPKELRKEMTGKVRKDNNVSTPFPITTMANNGLTNSSSNINKKVSHLVARTPRSSTQTSSTEISGDNSPSMDAGTVLDKLKSPSSHPNPANSTEKTQSYSVDSGSVLEKTKPHLINAATSSEKTKVQSVDTKTLEEVETKTGTTSVQRMVVTRTHGEKTESASVSRVPHVEKVKHHFALSGVEIGNQFLSTNTETTSKEETKSSCTNTESYIEKTKSSPVKSGSEVEKSKHHSSISGVEMSKRISLPTDTGMYRERTRSESPKTKVPSSNTASNVAKTKHHSIISDVGKNKPALLMNTGSARDGRRSESPRTKSSSLTTACHMEKVKHPSDVMVNKPHSTNEGVSCEKTKPELSNSGISPTYVEKSKSSSVHTTTSPVKKVKHQFAITGVEIMEEALPSNETIVNSSSNLPHDPVLNLNTKLDKETSVTKSSNSLNPPSSASISAVVKKTSLPFNISTRKSPRVFDTTPYPRLEASSDCGMEQTVRMTKEETKSSVVETGKETVTTITKTFNKSCSNDEDLKSEIEKKKTSVVNGLDFESGGEVTVIGTVDNTTSNSVNSDSSIDCKKNDVVMSGSDGVIDSLVPANDSSCVGSSSLEVSDDNLGTSTEV